MYVYRHNEIARPTSELLDKLNLLSTIAVLAKIADLTDYYNEARKIYNDLVNAYNSEAQSSTERGFWGQVLDEITWTQRGAHKLDLMESCDYYTDKLKYAQHDFSKQDCITMLRLLDQGVKDQRFLALLNCCNFEWLRD